MLEDLVRWLEDSMSVLNGIHRLNQLDDRLLADMGIDRADIPGFVRGDVKGCAQFEAEAPSVLVGSPHPRVPRNRGVAARLDRAERNPTQHRLRVQH